MKIFTKLAYQYIAIFFNFSTTSNPLQPLQVENCDSNSRLVVDEDDNGKFRLKRLIVKCITHSRVTHFLIILFNVLLFVFRVLIGR